MILNHAHGKANNRCQEPECVAAFNRYQKQWRLDRLRGKARIVDPEPVLMHIATLTGLGWTISGIEGAAGVGRGTLWHLRNRSERITARNAAAILAVDPYSLPSNPVSGHAEPMVPALGARRRLEALQVMGWTFEALAERYGTSRSALRKVKDSQRVLRSTHDAVAALYRDLSHKRGPSESASRRALARGYVGPTAWDDIDHDPEPEDETEDVA